MVKQSQSQLCSSNQKWWQVAGLAAHCLKIGQMGLSWPLSQSLFFKDSREVITVIAWGEQYGSQEMIIAASGCSLIIIGNCPHSVCVCVCVCVVCVYVCVYVYMCVCMCVCVCICVYADP
jgi:hypothetical protein